MWLYADNHTQVDQRSALGQLLFDLTPQCSEDFSGLVCQLNAGGNEPEIVFELLEFDLLSNIDDAVKPRDLPAKDVPFYPNVQVVNADTEKLGDSVQNLSAKFRPLESGSVVDVDRVVRAVSRPGAYDALDPFDVLQLLFRELPLRVEVRGVLAFEAGDGDSLLRFLLSVLRCLCFCDRHRAFFRWVGQPKGCTLFAKNVTYNHSHKNMKD